MTEPRDDSRLRDGKETMPEVVELETSSDEYRDWREQDDFLNEALEETFPASAPISPSHPAKHLPRRPGDADPSGAE